MKRGIIGLVIVLLIIPVALAAEAKHRTYPDDLAKGIKNRITFDVIDYPVLLNIRTDGNIGDPGGYAWIRVDGPRYTIDLPFATQSIKYGVRKASDASAPWVSTQNPVGLGVASTGETPGYATRMAAETGGATGSGTGSGASSGTGSGTSGDGGTGTGTGTGSGTLADPCPETLPEAQQKKHLMKFYLNQELLPDEAALNFAKANLPKYVEHMNCILRKNTNRRLVFDPEKSVVKFVPQFDGDKPWSGSFSPSVICSVPTGGTITTQDRVALQTECATKVYLDRNNQLVTITQKHQISPTLTGDQLECKTSCYSNEALRASACSNLATGQPVAALKVCPPISGTDANGLPVYNTPTEGFEIWAHIAKTTQVVSHGGNAVLHDDGQGVLAALKWTKLYDPDTLATHQLDPVKSDDPLNDYWTQINNMLHEFGHVFDVAVSEYYTITILPDHTGTDPDLDISIANVGRGTNDAYWSAPEKSGYGADPMTNSILSTAAVSEAEKPKTVSQLLQKVKYSDLTAAMVGGNLRGKLSDTLPDLSNIGITVRDSQGNPVSGAKVTLFRVNSQTETQFAKVLDAQDAPDGRITFNWAWQNLNKDLNPVFFNPSNNARLIKVQAPGFQPAGKWVTIFDAQEVKLLKGQTSWIIVVEMQRSS